jgi:hypothetical protein
METPIHRWVVGVVEEMAFAIVVWWADIFVVLLLLVPSSSVLSLLLSSPTQTVART